MIKRSPAYLVLDDGRIFEGFSWAKSGETFGEAVFSTGMTGYQETLTDPSYHKQIVIMTAPDLWCEIHPQLLVTGEVKKLWNKS